MLFIAREAMNHEGSGVIINTLLILFLLWIVFQRVLPLQGVKQITTAELQSELKNKDKQFIDVRTPHEFRNVQGILKGSTIFPYLTCLVKLISFRKTKTSL